LHGGDAIDVLQISFGASKLNKRLAIILGIRPDVVRASILLDILRSNKHGTVFIWSGQHYSSNMKDVFFSQLHVGPPDFELNAHGESDSEIVASVISRLFRVLNKIRPAAAVFLGDTNTVMGCVAAAQLNIPVVHIEGCMRSYDWRMPEEKYRVVTDHLSDVIYAYLDEYKGQGIAEGLNPDSIVVTGNPIVDVLERHFLARNQYYEKLASDNFFGDRGIRKKEFYLMTCHRRENVENALSLANIMNLAGGAARPVYFPASYRTERMMKFHSIDLPKNVKMVEPIGYDEFLTLMSNSRGVLSDSGTVAEEACVLRIPSIQMRLSTERPQLYDVGASVKFNPLKDQNPKHALAKLEGLYGKTWQNPLGDGKSSERIAVDLLRRLQKDEFERHRPADYCLDISHSFRDDGL
jgi:UDP-N-acetylglucosamine 2-epimerase (non-hydrolysing)